MFTQDALLVVCLYLFIVFPFISLIHSISLSFGLWFALSRDDLLFRIFELVGFFLLSIFTVALYGGVLGFYDYSLPISDVVLVTIWLIARNHGVVISDVAPIERFVPPLKSRLGQISLSLVVFWLPLAVSYAVNIMLLFRKADAPIDCMNTVIEVLLFVPIFLTVTWINLKYSQHNRSIFIGLVVLWPFIIGILCYLFWAFGELFIPVQILHCLALTALATIYAVPMFTLILKIFR
jgi:hypothetical protein